MIQLINNTAASPAANLTPEQLGQQLGTQLLNNTPSLTPGVSYYQMPTDVFYQYTVIVFFVGLMTALIVDYAIKAGWVTSLLKLFKRNHE